MKGASHWSLERRNQSRLDKETKSEGIMSHKILLTIWEARLESSAERSASWGHSWYFYNLPNKQNKTKNRTWWHNKGISAATWSLLRCGGGRHKIWTWEFVWHKTAWTSFNLAKSQLHAVKWGQWHETTKEGRLGNCKNPGGAPEDRDTAFRGTEETCLVPTLPLTACALSQFGCCSCNGQGGRVFLFLFSF